LVFIVGVRTVVFGIDDSITIVVIIEATFAIILEDIIEDSEDIGSVNIGVDIRNIFFGNDSFSE
jgi:hypothetical protein